MSDNYLTNDDITDRYADIKVVVPISGGKDSQACLKLALEQYEPSQVLGLFCDTQWEHPLTYQHIDNMANWYQVPIVRVNEGSVEDKIKRYKKFPSSMLRFCTSDLKITPSRKFYDALSQSIGGFEVWYGMRGAESTDRAKRYQGRVSDECYLPHEINKSYPQKLGNRGVRFRLPIVHWSNADVFEYVGKEYLNPLYQSGFDRVGCFPCLASGNKNQHNAFSFDLFGASQKLKVVKLEQAIGKKHLPANTDQFCMFCHV